MQRRANSSLVLCSRGLHGVVYFLPRHRLAPIRIYNTLNYHLVTEEPPFILKPIDCMEQIQNRNGK